MGDALEGIIVNKYAFILLALVQLSSGFVAYGFTGKDGVCAVSDRAIVYYDGQIYVLEQGTCVITEYLKDKRYAKILNILPDNVKLVGKLQGTVVPQSQEEITIGAEVATGDKNTWMYLSLTSTNTLSLTPKKDDGMAKWRDVQSRGRIKDPVTRDAYQTWTHQFETVPNEKEKKRVVAISTQKTAVKDRHGDPINLYALVLSEKDDPAKFEIIEFSSK